jgi:sugar lactone lactonase YvrE
MGCISACGGEAQDEPAAAAADEVMDAPSSDGRSKASQLVLPGDRYFPESLSAAADGTLFVGSAATGQVVRFAPESTTPVTFLPGGAPDIVTGVLADSGSSTLYLCAVDLTVQPPASELRTYDLDTALPKASYSFGGPAFCNDLAFDEAGNLFVTDSLGRVLQLPRGGSTLGVWKSDDLLVPSSAAGLGADGIVVDGRNVYVSAFSDSRLIRIPINEDGTAGTAVQLTVTPALQGPDAMRRLRSNTLVVVEGFAGNLTKIVVSGGTATAQVVRSGFKGPTSVVKSGSSYWVTEGQLSHLLDNTSPVLPFLVKRVPATP